jgi:hypothetical protein
LETASTRAYSFYLASSGCGGEEHFEQFVREYEVRAVVTSPSGVRLSLRMPAATAVIVFEWKMRPGGLAD